MKPLLNPQQALVVERMRALEVADGQTGSMMLWLDMGFGKTKCVLSFVKTRRTIVVAPKAVIENTWANVLDQDRYVLVENFRRKTNQAQFVLMNYEKSHLLDHIYAAIKKDKFQYIVFDESTRLSGGGLHAKNFLSFCRKCPDLKRILLSATPATRGLDKLWAQSQFLQKQLLANSKRVFLETYFNLRNINGALVAVGEKPGALEAITQKMSPYVISLSNVQVGKLPKTIYQNIYFDIVDMKPYLKMKRHMVISDTIHAPNKGAQFNKLLQLCSGFCMQEDGFAQVYDCNIDSKINAMLQYLLDLQGQRCIIWAHWKEDAQRILNCLKTQNFQVSEINQESITQWNNSDSLRILVGNPSSCGYGINIYKNCRQMLFYSMFWNAESYTQAVGRLSPMRRIGESSDTVITHLLAKDDRLKLMDSLVLERASKRISLSMMMKRALEENN